MLLKQLDNLQTIKFTGAVPPPALQMLQAMLPAIAIHYQLITQSRPPSPEILYAHEGAADDCHDTTFCKRKGEEEAPLSSGKRHRSGSWTKSLNGTSGRTLGPQ